jgi:hypothetical protein
MPNADGLTPQYINTIIKPLGMEFVSINGSEWKYCLWFKSMEIFDTFYNACEKTQLFAHVKASSLRVTDNDALLLINNFDMDDWEDFFSIYFSLDK